jgi:hypothetical protein
MTVSYAQHMNVHIVVNKRCVRKYEPRQNIITLLVTICRSSLLLFLLCQQHEAVAAQSQEAACTLALLALAPPTRAHGARADRHHNKRVEKRREYIA